MTNYIGGGLLHRRNMMKLAESIELMTFEAVDNAVFYNRYNSANQPYYCDIYGNHIDMNTGSQNSSIWFWGGNLSAYNTQNRQWLFVPNGTIVKLVVNYNTLSSYANMNVGLKDASSTSPNVSWLGCSANGINSTNKGIITNTKTATSDIYLYVSFNTTPANIQWSVDVEIYMNGVRVL